MLAVVLVHVIGLVLGADVGVAGDGADRLALDAEGGEELFGVLQQHVLGEDVPHAPLSQDKVGGQALGNRNETQGLLAVALQPQHDVEHLIGQVGEGVAGVHHLGRENGLQLIPEPVFHLLALLGIHLVHGHTADVAGAQPLFQLVHHFVPHLVQGGDRLVDGGELLVGRLTGTGVKVGLLHQSQVAQRAYPDHKELVQVAGKNGGKFQPLHQRHALVLGLLQYTFVKPQPGQLTVLGIAGIHDFRHTVIPLSFDPHTCRSQWRARYPYSISVYHSQVKKLRAILLNGRKIRGCRSVSGIRGRQIKTQRSHFQKATE